MINIFRALAASLLLIFGAADAANLDKAAVDAFIGELVTNDGFDAAELTRIFEKAQRSKRILKAMSRPAEKSKPWHEYRKHFLTDLRIAGGIEFWNTHAETLHRATDVYGVPPEIIVAIIGVETAYGKITGGDQVVDALSTLAFHYPKGNVRRMTFFRAQLRQLFLMSREQDLDPLELKGSYAGAMGIPQFMPESYRKFAVDFNDDGERNIWKDRSDAIGSVANYLKSHGWSRGGPIVLPASTSNSKVDELLTDSVKPNRRLSDFATHGVTTSALEADELAALFTLEGEASLEYWLALNNFYAIMKYNPRTKYAMAVVKLAEAIRNARLAQQMS
ncbi:MAG: membrane-bound lytic murein transglycosylase B [Gammaproteobacteria bacterium]|jgi:membrane-bound lytic murein transglycosylase B